MLRSEADAEGVVAAVHGGSADAVPLVEGCAEPGRSPATWPVP